MQRALTSTGTHLYAPLIEIATLDCIFSRFSPSAVLRVIVSRLPFPNKTWHPFFLFFPLENLQAVGNERNLLWENDQSIQYRSALIFYSGSQGPFMVVMGQRHKQSVQTLHRGDSLAWLTWRHCGGQKWACAKCRFQWKTPRSLAWLTWKRTQWFLQCEVIRTISRWLYYG